MIQNEGIKHAQAFEYYFALGGERSYSKVAQEFSVSKTSVMNWARQFKWQERLREREKDAMERLERKTMSTVVNDKAKYRKIIRDAIEQFAGDLADGKVKIESVLDLERLMKLDLLLAGETTERTELKGEVNTNVKTDIADLLKGDEDARELAKRLFRKRIADNVE